MQKLNLKYGDIVIASGLGSELDGIKLKVIGVAFRNFLDTYILEFNDGKTKMTYEGSG